MKDSFSLSFKASEREAETVIRSVADRLRQAGLDQERVGEVEVAVAETVNNVIEHAYAGAAPGLIRLRCSLRRKWLDIRISDSGRPLPGDRLPPGLAADVSTSRADLPEGGFGWFLIRAFTTDIRYDRCGGSNHLSLRFQL